MMTTTTMNEWSESDNNEWQVTVIHRHGKHTDPESRHGKHTMSRVRCIGCSKSIQEMMRSFFHTCSLCRVIGLGGTLESVSTKIKKYAINPADT